MSAAQRFPSDDPALSRVRGRRKGLWGNAVALVECVVAVLLVAAAFRMWGRAVVPFDLPALPEVTDAVSRMLGNWVAGAIAVTCLAGLLLLDCVRRLVAGRVLRGRRAERVGHQPAERGTV